jgi:hypothetical protein
MNYAFKISLKLEEHLARLMNDEATLAQAHTALYLNRALDLQQTSQDVYGGELGAGWTNTLAAPATAQDEDDDDKHSEEALGDLALRAAIDEACEETGKMFNSGVEWSGVALWREHSHRRFRCHRV